MKSTLKAALYLCACTLAFSQVQGGGPKPVAQMNYTVQTRPQALPTSLTAVVAQDAYICFMDIEATGQNILIQDRQATPVVYMNNTLGSAGNLTTYNFFTYDDGRCRWFPNGISIQAGASGATGYMTIKCLTTCTLNWGQ